MQTFKLFSLLFFFDALPSCSVIFVASTRRARKPPATKLRIFEACDFYCTYHNFPNNPRLNLTGMQHQPLDRSYQSQTNAKTGIASAARDALRIRTHEYKPSTKSRKLSPHYHRHSLARTTRHAFFDLPRELRDEIYSFAPAGTTILFQLQDIDGIAEASCGEKHAIQKRRFAFPWWIYTTQQIRQEATEQFHRRARFTLDFDYQPSCDETNYIWSYSRYTDALQYIPNINLARYVTILNVGAHYGSPIASWIPRVSKRIFRSHQLTLSLLQLKIVAVRRLDIRFTLSGREKLLVRPILDSLRYIYPEGYSN
jgi:hypothetical protein